MNENAGLLNHQQVSIDPVAFSQLMQVIGYTLWQLAECEDAVAHFLVMRHEATRGMGQDAGEALLTKARGKTFGALLKSLKQRGALPAEIIDRLEFVVEERNWLAHRSKREFRGVMYSASRYAILSDRLAKLSEEALALQKSVAAQLESWVLAQGVTKDYIDKQVLRNAQALMRGDPDF